MEKYTKLAVFENKTIIGLTGVAGSGKDTFFEILKTNFIPSFQRFALADSLKNILREDLKEKFGIDIVTCSREDKNKIRDHVVQFAKQKRIETEGRFWTSVLEREILNSNATHICITDIRHNFYPEDEVFWLKNRLGGKLINIELYDPNSGEKQPFPNEEEKFNYPLCSKAADYHVIWPKIGDKDQLNFFVDSAIKAVNLSQK